MSFAREASARGRKVLVLERNPTLGGLARSFRYEKFVFDYGLHVFVTRDSLVVGFMRSLLGSDFSAVEAKPASWLGSGKIVDDRAFPGGRRRAIPGPVSSREFPAWNYRQIGGAPTIIYPKRGGFARICENLAAEILQNGGTILFNAPVAPGDFKVRSGRLASIKIKGRETPIAGCYWASEPSTAPETQNSLTLYHFLLRGRAPHAYHWIRIDTKNPMMPSVVYYPSNLSRHNAPVGHYSLAAALFLPPSSVGLEDKREESILDWQRRDPKTFLPWMVKFLSGAGFLKEREIIGSRIEGNIPLPSDLAAGNHGKKARLPRIGNFWDGASWFRESAGESLMSAQIKAARAAARDILDPRAPAARAGVLPS